MKTSPPLAGGLVGGGVSRNGQSGSLPECLGPARGGAAPVAEGRVRVRRPRHRGPHRGRQQSLGIRTHQAAPSCPGRCVRPQCRHHAVRQAGRPADGDRAHRCGRPVLARRRTGTRARRGEGADPADAVHRVDDADGEDRRRRWPAVVPALCLEAPRPVAPVDRTCPSQRLRGADRHGGFPGLGEPRIQQPTTASACRSIRPCGLPST